MSYFGKIFIKTVGRYVMITADIFLFMESIRLSFSTSFEDHFCYGLWHYHNTVFWQD